MQQISRVRLCGVIAALLFAATCDHPTSSLPTAPGEPTITGLRIEGPDSLAPGQSVQFSAVAQMSDGTTKVATYLQNIQWGSFSPGDYLIQINSTGLATAGQTSGDAFVSVHVPVPRGGLESTKEVTVLPDGTYRLVGRVAEVEFPTAFIEDARVTVNPGSLATTTDANGEYRLYGVHPNAEIRVTATGYQPHVEQLQLDRNTTKDIRLALSGQRVTLSGSYTLTIDLTGSCVGPQSLAPELLHRTYEADATQNGSTVVVTLTEPRFRVDGERGNSFQGRADASRIHFDLSPLYLYYYYYGPIYPDVAERLSDGSYLVPSGSVFVTRSGNRWSGQLAGFMSKWDSRFPDRRTQLLGSCDGLFLFRLTPR